jgi:hypothetical protein
MMTTFAPVKLFEQTDVAKKTQVPYHPAVSRFEKGRGLGP